jgi:hypothetical protein
MVFQDTDYQPIITGAPQLNAHVCCTAPAPAKSPLQHSPGLTVLHSPPLPPAEGEEGGLESFNDSPVVPHVLLSSGLHTVSSVVTPHVRSRHFRKYSTSDLMELNVTFYGIAARLADGTMALLLGYRRSCPSPFSLVASQPNSLICYLISYI